eukprot:gene17509-23821_t
MGAVIKSRSPEGNMLPANLFAFWSSVSEAPWSIFVDSNQGNVQENLRSTAKLLSRYLPSHPYSMSQDFMKGTAFLGTATSDVGGLVLSRWWIQGDAFVGEKGEQREEREASIVLRSVETVQAISDLIAAAKFCGAGLIVRNCLRWLQPTMKKIERCGSGLGTCPGLRLVEKTNLVQTCMDLLEWARSMEHIKDLDVLIFETIGIMGQSEALINQAGLHPQLQYLQYFARPELMKPRPSQRAADLSQAEGSISTRRTVLDLEIPECGDADHVLLEELAGRLEETERRESRGPPMTARQRQNLLLKFLTVGRSAVIERLKQFQVTLRCLYQNGHTFDIDLISFHVSPRLVEERHAGLELSGLKGEWNARDYLQSEFNKQVSTDLDQLYGCWSSEYVYDQLRKGNLVVLLLLLIRLLLPLRRANHSPEDPMRYLAYPRAQLALRLPTTGGAGALLGIE